MFLRRIRISKVRAIDEIELDFTEPDGSVRARTVLLGENGCGKSTAIRAIGLLLAGSNALPVLIGEPKRWVRSKSKVGEISATIETADGERREVSLTLRSTDDLKQMLRRNEKGLALLDAATKHADRSYFVMGYGVSRRPSHGEFAITREHGAGGARAQALATMFNPEARLVSFEQWAMDLEYRSGPKALAVVKSAVKKLLPGMSLSKIDRRRGEVIFSTPDGPIPFRQLSDGYQNVANWCGDMLYRITRTFKDYRRPLTARGLLLVDELDLHLHPVWQRHLMAFLSGALPNMQIIGTSHSPIIAQQLRERELYVVERPGPKAGAGIRAVQGDPSRLTLTQLLSPMFGIESSESLRVQQLRELARSQPTKLSAEQRAQLQEMRRDDVLPPAVKQQMAVTAQLRDVLAMTAAGGPGALQVDPMLLRRKFGAPMRVSEESLRARDEG